MASGRKKDLIRAELLNRLFSRHYRYGDRILVKQLIEDTGASRQPVMAALEGLAAEGFVRIVAQVGCEVVSPSAREVADFYLMFGRNEGLMTQLAAERGSARQLAELRGINARIADIAVDLADAAERYRLLNRAFHRLIHGMAASPLLQSQHDTAFSLSDFFIGQSDGFTPHIREATQEHDAVITALAARDSVAAREKMETHIQMASRQAMLAFAKDGLAA